jgi:hypothetical protein
MRKAAGMESERIKRMHRKVTYLRRVVRRVVGMLLCREWRGVVTMKRLERKSRIGWECFRSGSVLAADMLF